MAGRILSGISPPFEHGGGTSIKFLILKYTTHMAVRFMVVADHAGCFILDSSFVSDYLRSREERCLQPVHPGLHGKNRTMERISLTWLTKG
jgi:hypothetical protein